MKRIKEWWRNIVDYLRWCATQNDPIIQELEDTCDKATMYERIERYYPNILARLNVAAEKKEKAKNKT